MARTMTPLLTRALGTEIFLDEMAQPWISLPSQGELTNVRERSVILTHSKLEAEGGLADRPNLSPLSSDLRSAY
jgi:hypothetical protein